MLINAVMDIVDSCFEYRLVEDFPVEHASWQAYAASILEKAAPAMDLTPEQVKLILQADNGDWTKSQLFHYCLSRNRCPLGCNGCRRRSLQIFKGLVFLTICSRMEKALCYRWKGMEKANAWALRGRKQHDLLGRGLHKTWPARVLRQAEVAAGSIAEDSLPDAIKHAVRASRCIQNLAADEDGVYHEAACHLHPLAVTTCQPPSTTECLRHMDMQKFIIFQSC